MILALDMSISNAGGCIFTDDGKPSYIFSISTSSKNETKDRLREIGNFLENLKNEYNITVVAFERGFARFNKSTQTLFKVIGVASYIFSNCEQYFYPPSTVKKIVTGNGRSDKKIVEEYVLRKWPELKFKNNDESDAAGVGLCHLIKVGIDV